MLTPKVTFKDIFTQASRGLYCTSNFAEMLIGTLQQFKSDITFNNQDALSMKEVLNPNKDGAMAKQPTIRDTSASDVAFLRNLQATILNTKFDVRIGTSISYDGKTASGFPTHVAKLFEICQKALEKAEKEQDPEEKIRIISQARYDAVALSAECYRHPHNNFFSFFNTRRPTTQNFYGIVASPKGFEILEKANLAAEGLNKEDTFLNGPSK